MRYSPERKEAVLRKMMPPHNRTIRELAKAERISEATLYNWRQQARDKGLLMPDADTSPEGWAARDKFAAVIESASFTEAELAEYCRKKEYTRNNWLVGKLPVNVPMTGIANVIESLRKDKKKIAIGLEISNANCGEKIKPWRKPRP